MKPTMVESIMRPIKNMMMIDSGARFPGVYSLMLQRPWKGQPLRNNTPKVCLEIVYNFPSFHAALIFDSIYRLFQ